MYLFRLKLTAGYEVDKSELYLDSLQHCNAAYMFMHQEW